MRTLLFVLSFFLSCDVAFAQTDAEQAPPAVGSLLRQPQAYSAWEIDFSYGSDKDKDKQSQKASAVPPPIQAGSISTARPRTIKLTFTSPLWHAMVINTDGRRLDEWSDGYAQYLTSDSISDGLVVPTDKDGRPIIPNFGKSPFPQTEWISRTNYAGEEPVNFHKCFAFKNGGISVWVDVQTLYPIKWQKGDETRTFTQLASPSGMLTLPPEILQTASKYQRYLKATSCPAPSGG